MTTETALEVAKPEAPAFGRDQVELIKRTVARGTTDDELKLFLYTAQRTGLDPLAKQIHAIKRWSNREKREVMSIQTGIDGYRLIAERTGAYAPGQEPKILMGDKWPASATAYVKKLVAGTWHEIAATAYWEEFVQTDREGRLTPMWSRMPKLMLSKCAEALALRRAFPAEMGGVYTFDEMAQADHDPQPEMVDAEPVEDIKGKLEDALSDAEAKHGKKGAPEKEPPSAHGLECPHCGSGKTMKSKFPKKGAYYCLDCKEGFDA